MDAKSINSKSLDSNLSKQALPVSAYVVVSICAYIEGFVTLRGNLQLFVVFKVTLFRYKVVLIKVTFLYSGTSLKWTPLYDGQTNLSRTTF